MADDTYSIASGGNLYAGYPPPADPEAPVIPLSFPASATSDTTVRSWYLGAWNLTGDTTYDNDEYPFTASYSRRKSQSTGRLIVTLHSSGGYNSFVNSSYTPPTGFDFEARTQDGQAKEQINPTQPAEWWCFGTDGLPYPARRVAAMLDVIAALHPTEFLYAERGIAINGNSMGNGGVLHSMILPDPWRARIAFCRGGVGIVMPRRVAEESPGQYNGWPDDDGSNDAIWDAVDFSIQAASDSIVRGMHYRQQFSSNDNFSEGPDGSTHLEFVKLCHDHKISLIATWVSNGHSTTESGINFPDVKPFASGQDVTLDRAFPCFTNSTGNYPVSAADITDRTTYPRGHYNLGLTWVHASTVDSATEIIFSIAYTRRTGMGGGIPDQDSTITVDVTPRREQNFGLTNGETISWTFDGGAQTGTAVVAGDVVTAVGISLTSGAAAKSLRFYRA